MIIVKQEIMNPAMAKPLNPREKPNVEKNILGTPTNIVAKINAVEGEIGRVTLKNKAVACTPLIQQTIY